MKQLWKLVLVVSTAASLAACTSTPENTAQVEDRNATTATNTAGSQGTGTTTAGVGAGTGVAGNNLQGNANNSGANSAGNSALRDPRSPLSRREIFYDLDSFTVKDEYKPLLEAHAAYLKNNRNARIKVEGNTDERGSREYNLALGQKRSESVKRVLMLLGVSEAQIDTVSFGEEKPRNTAANDAAYSENRRCDLAYAGE